MRGLGLSVVVMYAMPNNGRYPVAKIVGPFETTSAASDWALNNLCEGGYDVRLLEGPG
jgi:hypothetical protein